MVAGCRPVDRNSGNRAIRNSRFCAAKTWPFLVAECYQWPPKSAANDVRQSELTVRQLKEGSVNVWTILRLDLTEQSCWGATTTNESASKNPLSALC